MQKVFVSNVQHYTGPGVVQVLSESGYQVICHDPAFTDVDQRGRYCQENNLNSEHIVTLTAQNPEEIAQALEEIGQVSRFVFNDVHPNTPKPFEQITLEELRAAHQALVEFPFRLCQLILPALKQQSLEQQAQKQQQGCAIAFITSARQLQPEPGFVLATSIRAGATALAQAVAREAAPFGIQVNAIQPNYLYSELYYPKAKFIDDEEGREHIAQRVPAGRLGQPEEFGALVEFYISGRSPFATGQVINFTGGWP